MTDPRGDRFTSGPHHGSQGPHPAGNDPTVDPESGCRVPDHVVDSFLDGELKREDSARLFAALRHDAAAARELVGIQRAIDALRQPVAAPDFTSKILSEVGRRKGWLNWSQRRSLWRGRVAAAGLLLVLLSGVYVGQRVAPQATIAGRAPAPINELARAVPHETADAARAVREAVITVKATMQGNVLFARTDAVAVAEPARVELIGPPADLAALPILEPGNEWRPIGSGHHAVAGPVPHDAHTQASFVFARPAARTQSVRLTETGAAAFATMGSMQVGRDDPFVATHSVIVIPGR